MQLLLDTHVLIWIVTGDDRLTEQVRALVEDESNVCYFSPVSIAEIALKHQKHPEVVKFDGPAAKQAFIATGCRELEMKSDHVVAISDMQPFHHDPIDRMLLAQAKSEGIKIVSHDRQFPQYGDFVIKA